MLYDTIHNLLANLLLISIGLASGFHLCKQGHNELKQDEIQFMNSGSLIRALLQV